ncbi:hypothetical protein CUMW_258540, partial [Citrus unshiu]
MGERFSDVAHNSLSGIIPRCINNFTAMAAANSSNQDNAISYIRGGISDVFEDASVVTKGSTKGTDKSYGIAVIKFSHNFFTGKIPENIGNMRSIESLDFSMNQLSGKVPQSMSSLSFLNHLNLSYNNFTGKIPSSTQLQSMDASSFAGNNLCGAPLPDCPEKNALVPEDRNENGNEDEDEVDWLLY